MARHGVFQHSSNGSGGIREVRSRLARINRALHTVLLSRAARTAKMWSLLFVSLFQLLAIATSQSTPATIDVIPATVADGPSTVEFISTGTGFDGPKVKPLNGSTFDWWYFDVVSEDTEYSMILVFFASSPNGLWPGIDPGFPSAVFGGAWIFLPDGTNFTTAVLGEDLTVVTLGDGSSGTLNGTEWSWSGLPDMSQYEITIDSPDGSIEGTVSFQAVWLCLPLFVASAHQLVYSDIPCSLPLRTDHRTRRSILRP